MSVTDSAEHLSKLKGNLATVIQGKDEALEVLTIALAAGGSVLIEDVPGVGKTTLAKALAQSVEASFSRVQFTPDRLPADIAGSSIYNPVDGTFSFRRGAVFYNVLLAGETNRASPRTQSALLEAMSEAQATIEGTQYPLPSPFVVLATENPVEFHGTYPLPEAQLDRFLVRLELGYPEPAVETQILYAQQQTHPLEALEAVLTCAEVVELQRAVREVAVEESVGRYVVDLVAETRADDRLKLGVSPRGSLMLSRAAQAAALSQGRGYVLPDDVQRLAPQVLPHRLVLTSKAKYGGAAKGDVIREILGRVRVPT